MSATTTTTAAARRKALAPSAGNTMRRRMTGWLVYGFTGICTVIAVGLLVYLLTYLIFQGASAINWEFLTSNAAAVGEEGGGILASMTGTALIVTMAVLLGVPIGMLIGVFLSEMTTGDSAFSNTARVAVNTFTGIPSIIVGIFVYTVVVKPMGQFSAIGGGVALAIIMIPIVARTAEDVLRLVPGSIREAGLALGIPQWRVTLGLVLPAARAGLITGCVLAVARVAGETAPLILTALGSEYVNLDPTQPTDELTLRILKYARGPYDTWHHQAYGAALVLVLGIAAGALLLRVATRGRGIKLQ